MSLNLVFVLFPGVTQLDFTGAAQVLSRLPDARVHVAARELAPVPTDCGFAIMPTVDFASCPCADLLCVPGGHGIRKALADPATIRFVKTEAETATYVTSVCTGALLLGAAGLLNGKNATTHWAYTDLLSVCGARHVPGRVVTDGTLITGGGVTAGIDFGFTVAATIAGEEMARAIQLGLEYNPAPPFDSGHPDNADAATLALVREKYRRPVADLRLALEQALSVTGD